MTDNKTAYKKVLAEYDLPIFYQDWWLDAVCQNHVWDVIIDYDKGGNPRGVCPVVSKNKYGLKSIGLPPLTPYLGIYFIYPHNLVKRERRYAFEIKVSQSIIKQLPTFSFYNVAFHPAFTNWTPFHWQGYHSKLRYTYQINGSKEQAYENLKSETRNIIKSQDKKAITISESMLGDDFYTLSQHHAAERKFNLPYSRATFNSLDAVLLTKKCRTIYSIEKGGKLLAAVYMINNQTTDYCIAVANKNDNHSNQLVVALLWKAISICLKNEKTFDFEGSMLPGVESFFRSFGGERVSFLQLSKVPNALLRGLVYGLKKL